MKKPTGTPAKHYGCHNRQPFPATVKHSSGAPSWPFLGSRNCNYDRNHEDPRCAGCRHLGEASP